MVSSLCREFVPQEDKLILRQGGGFFELSKETDKDTGKDTVKDTGTAKE